MRNIYIILFALLLTSCSLIKSTFKEPAFEINEVQLITSIKESFALIIEEAWLTDYIQQHNERPTIIMSRVVNLTGIVLNEENIFNQLNKELTNTGQVRVLKATESQRILNPLELSHVASVDFVLSTIINKDIDTTPHKAFVELSIWNRMNDKPLSTIKITIE